MARQKLEENKNNDLEARVIELERTVKALLRAIKDAEKVTDQLLMPEGEYFSEKFE